MPRLPDANDLGQTQFRQVRQAVNVPTPDIAGAMKNLARGVADVGDDAQRYAVKQDERVKLQERFDTRMGLLKARENIATKLQDLDPLDPQYADKVRGLYKENYAPVLTAVQHPENRQYFDESTYEDFVSAGMEAEGAQKKAFAGKAELDLDALTEADQRRIRNGEDPQKVLGDNLAAVNENGYIDDLTKQKISGKNRTTLISTALGKKGADLYSGGGSASDKAVAILRKFEGFRDTPYMDVTKYRVGFGSDTVTLADGKVVPVQKGMKITREDAERDLQRRVGEFQAQAAKDAGPAWNNLTPDQQAALTSVAYNYGSLPKGVVAAIQTGDAGNIARSVQSLADHNKGVNYNRRMAEAAIIGGEQVRLPKEEAVQFVEQDPLFRELPVDEADRLKSDLLAQFKKSEEEDKSAFEARKVDLRTAISSDVASIANGGQPSKELSYQDIADVLGADEAEKWRQKTAEASEEWQVVEPFKSLSNVDIDQRVADYEALVESSKGKPEYSRRLAVLKNVKQRQAEELSLRKSRPTEAALRFDYVRKAADSYTEAISRPPRNPYEDRNAIVTEAFGNYLQATTEAQVGFGVPRQGVALVDDGTAQKISEYFLDLPANLTGKQDNVTARDTLTNVYKSLRNSFGDYTDEVIAYSLAKSKPLSKETTETMVGLLSSLAKGRSIQRSAVDTAQRLQDADEADPGLMGFFSDWFSDEKKPPEDTPLGTSETETIPAEDVAGAR